ncbi:MAG: DUF3793 family protein [Ruminococcus sp.]|nr:DUF3793 family protein [Ruminococcus sp.]
MSDEMILRHCAPTLARIKTANLFTCEVESSESLKEALRRYNKQFVKKGLRIMPLRYKGGRALIYVYRPSFLCEDLKHSYAKKLLGSLGYLPHSTGLSVGRLIKRLDETDGFPHEIGLFLGYPPEDVKGFIENGSRSYKFKGCWKVYSDEERAKKLFEKYKKCTSVYAEKWAQGRSLDKLTVATPSLPQ